MSDEQGETVEVSEEEETAPEADTTDQSEAADTGEAPDTEEPPDVEAVEQRVADSDTEAIADEIVTLETQLADLELRLEEAETERDDLEERLKRKQAEFQNYKKRQEKRREQERARATENLVEELLEVRDNLKRALEQDEDADIREGVEATFRQLDETLAGENVEPIEPTPGDEVDPKRHEVLLRVESDQPVGTIADVHRPGYDMAGKVLRAAQVTVSEESDDPGADGDTGAASADEMANETDE